MGSILQKPLNTGTLPLNGVIVLDSVVQELEEELSKRGVQTGRVLEKGIDHSEESVHLFVVDILLEDLE